MKEGHPGYGGEILRVNLSTGKTFTEPTVEYAERFVGGRGINAWVLFNESRTGVGSLDPENLLLFGAGALVGSLARARARRGDEVRGV